MKKLRACFVWLIVLAFLMTGADLLAKSRSGGGFRSSSRSSSRSTSRPKTSTKSTTSTKQKSTSSKRTTTAPKRSATQQKSYEKAKASGKAFGGRKAAAADFKTKNAGKFPSKYASKPATRPSHIPQTTSVNGVSHNVTYNVGHGGYGYMNGMGTFMAYSMMSDAIMMNTMMSRQGYYYDQPAAVHRRSSGATILIALLSIIGVIAVISIVVAASRGN